MSWFNKILFGSDPAEDEAISDKADADLRALNAKSGHDEAWQMQAEANIRAGVIDDAEGQVGDAFKEGFNDGVNNIKGFVGDAVSFPFRLIPWQVWALGAVALFFWMGGASLLKGRLARA